ncbi:hypothetical protein [Clostridium magnum]|uniref:Uncharacterized protein n=1 Tax=Clostridium magnum DSM 2767 TaxID=1121326 RepID=A0A162TLB4_9CLOT|nr:hypothetical protein [Clostridium magnum]KZL92791.1 hypothetical protein CLMAG_26050 [Clostridium magnum DSM 2767]SHJ40377.1 hypothetical protein SAMN02745944_05899 [Clostridium magnum DSM 2767]
MKKKLGFIYLALLLIFSVGFIRIVYASSTQSNIDKKIEQQNKDIKNNIKDAPDNGEKLDGLINQYNNDNKNSSGDFNKKELKAKIENGLTQTTITLRKYAIPIYTIFMLIMTVLISTVGAKSLEKRKSYIVWSLSVTIVFLFFLNLPILVIYFQNRAVEEILGSGGVYQALYGLIRFLQENSPVIAALLIVYGITNITLSKTDLPRRLQGRYMIKLAFIVLIVLQIFPVIINVIV